MVAWIYYGIFYCNADKVMYWIFRRRAGVIIGGNFAARRTAIDGIGGLPPFRFFGDDTAIALLIARKVGKVRFDYNLRILSSPRRFEKDGLIRTTLYYAWVFVKLYFKKTDALYFSDGKYPA
jgi:hypothetical protein